MSHLNPVFVRNCKQVGTALVITAAIALSTAASATGVSINTNTGVKTGIATNDAVEGRITHRNEVNANTSDNNRKRGNYYGTKTNASGSQVQAGADTRVNDSNVNSSTRATTNNSINATSQTRRLDRNLDTSGSTSNNNVAADATFTNTIEAPTRGYNRVNGGATTTNNTNPAVR